MPLIKSGTKAARDQNITEMVRAGHPVNQSVAAAYRNAREHGGHFAPGGRIDAPADAPHVTPSDRRGFDELMSIAQPPDSRNSGKPFMPGYAAGGAAASPPWFIRNEARTMGHQGFIGSIVPGRTDKHPMTVAGGSYVVPADVVSSIGQGNSLAGANKLGQMLRSGPYGSAAAAVPKSVKAIRQKFADGGEADAQAGDPADIVTAGGEYIIGPQDVHRLGGGNLDHGHSVLDEMVKHVRKSTIKTLRKLPGPKGAKK